MQPNPSDEDQSFYLDFNGEFFVYAVLASLFLAPIIPQSVAFWMVICSVVFTGLVTLSYHGARREVLQAPYTGKHVSLAQALVDEEVKLEFRVSTTTTTIMVAALTWLAFSGMLWLLDSFFALIVAIHSFTTVMYPLHRLRMIKGEIDEHSQVAFGPDPDNPE